MILIIEKKYYRKKGTVVWPAMFFGGFKLQPEKITKGKKGTVIWPTVETLAARGLEERGVNSFP